jgi:GNAT superfamily N-acetyltransferase
VTGLNVGSVSGILAESYARLTFAGLLPLLRRAGQEPGVVAVGADVGGEPAGLVLSERTGTGGAEIRSVAVDPRHRGCGVGVRLLAALQEELLRAGVTSLAATFPDDTPAGLRVGRLLRRCGFPEPAPYQLVCRSSVPRLAMAPWSVAPYPEDYEVFPWGELTEEDRADVASGRERLGYPEVLSPFRVEEMVDPAVSVGLRVRGRVLGWCIAHFRRQDSRWVDSLFRAAAAREGGGAAPLLGRLLHRMKQQDISFVEWSVDRGNERMLRFQERRLVPWGAEARSTCRATKVLSAPL